MQSRSTARLSTGVSYLSIESTTSRSLREKRTVTARWLGARYFECTCAEPTFASMLRRDTPPQLAIVASKSLFSRVQEAFFGGWYLLGVTGTPPVVPLGPRA